MKIKLDNRTTVELPIIPNFIKSGESTEPIARFTSKELRIIGKLWTEELVKLARKRRNK